MVLKLFFLLLLVASSLATTVTLDYLGAPCFGKTCDNGLECLSVKGGECPPANVVTDVPCTCGGVGGESDPYFTGFTGPAFYFRAEADNFYNLFSEQSHTINAHFVSTEMPEESDLLGLLTGSQNSSFIGTVGLQHGETTVAIQSDKKGNISVKINGEALDIGGENDDFEQQFSLPSNVTLFIQKFPLIWPTFVSVSTPLVMMGVYPEEPHMDNMGNLVRGHLSLQMGLRSIGEDESYPQAHGVLGQTIHPQNKTVATDAFPGEGEASDYIVSSLFASDFTFNMYTGEPPQKVPAKGVSQAISASRKLLKAQTSAGSQHIVRQTASFGTSHQLKHHKAL